MTEQQQPRKCSSVRVVTVKVRTTVYDSRRGYYKETGRDLGILRGFQSTEVFPLVEEERNIKHGEGLTRKELKNNGRNNYLMAKRPVTL
ncbi:hypothetical protein Pcinc_028521 [Petrolisthes cinctipes]|uniref:Uncharacterized protein n=1 Tax=Petrolisthes cinctipes TaxID=88211 RepID=A0AAE1F2R2_PETCI|nr:hypothetical protein Pcinc_028521 [Petrolisthes cinctipes]